MTPHRLAGLVLLVGAPAFPVLGQTSSGGESDELQKLKADVKSARAAALKSGIDQLEKASSSPRAAQEFFFDCVKKFDFKQDLDVASKFEQWKTGFAAQWRGHDLGLVLQMQLRYQALILRSVGAEDRATLIPAWRAFAESIVKHAPEAAYGVSFLSQPVNSCVFDKALKLSQLAGVNAFAVNPIDIGGIFDVQIHPHVKPEERAATWRQRIAAQKEFADVAMLPSEREDFANFEIPRLQWRALLDVHFHDGKPDASGFKEATQFIRRNQLHPDALAWVSEIARLRERPPDAAP